MGLQHEGIDLSTRQLYLLAYDVSSPRRLRDALAVARCYSTGGQRSVHECFLTVGERSALLAEYDALLDPSCDRLLMLRLDSRSRTYALGIGQPPADPTYFYVG